MTSLLDLSAEARRVEYEIFKIAETNGGEIDAGLDSYLAEVERSVAEKADSYVYVMDALAQTAEMLSEKADKIARAARAVKNAREAMRDRVKLAMHNMASDRIEGNDWVFSLSRLQPKLEVDVKHDALPPDCVIIRTEYEIDKKRIRELIESGRDIPGCRLVENHALRVNVNNKGAK